MNKLLTDLITQKRSLQRQLRGLDELLVGESRWKWVKHLVEGQNPVVRMSGKWVVIEFEVGGESKRIWYTEDSTFNDFKKSFEGWPNKVNIYV